MTFFLSPYPGLRPFDIDESHLFFGREEQTDELLRRLRDTRFLAVVGPSGCGKSSLVRAGMISSLQSGFMVGAGSRWRFAIMRPGAHPLHNLAAALVDQDGLDGDQIDRAAHIGVLGATLRRGPLGLVEAMAETPLQDTTNLLVLVDQFEEIFRFRRENDSGEADAFVSLLLASARQRDLPIYIVITMRSDFFGDCATFIGLPEALNRSQYLTPRLTRDQRRSAITGPARVFEGDVTPDLVNRLLNEMGTDPDQLPLMQHLLMRMWTWQTPEPDSAASQADADGEFRFEGAGRVLTQADQDAVGGLRHALSNHADEAFDRLDPHQQRVAEALFRCLSERGPDGRDIRRPTQAAEVAMVAGASLEAIIGVVEVFRAPTCSFVVPPLPEPIDAESVLDITHEALIRQWGRLRDWAADEAQLAETYLFLERNAQMWTHDHMAPWGTPNLEMALDWRERAQPTPAWAARYGGDFGLAMRFLDVSAAARKAREQEQLAQRRRQVRRWRQLALASAVLAAGSAGTLFGAWWMFVKEHVAYYIAFEKRWGEPIGIGVLTEDQVHHRASSLMFVRQGVSWDLYRATGNLHPTIRVEAVAADGHCTSNNDIGTYLNTERNESPLHECRIEFTRAAGSDEIVYETAYAADGSVRWGYNYVASPHHASQRIGYYLGRDGYFAKFPNSLAEVVTFTYSDAGNEIRRQYADHSGHHQPGPDRAYGQTITYDAAGRKISLTSIDDAGNPMNDTLGNATWRADYDNAGNEIRNWALDKDGKPVMWKMGYQRRDMSYDEYDRLVTYAYFDDTGGPTNADGVHQTKRVYDEKGKEREESYFDREDKPITSKGGYHRIVGTEFTPDGRWLRWAYFGRAGEIAADAEGAHEYIVTVDTQGFERSRQALGPDERPVASLNGCDQTRTDHDANGFVSSTSCFDGDGNPAIDNDGVHKRTFRHDDRGNQTERAIFGRDGEPITTLTGFHRSTNTYDPLGNVEETAYFGANGQPVRIATGYSKILTPHDQRGNVISRSYVDENGHHVQGPEGYARKEIRYDSRDNAIERAYYDDEQHLTAQSKEAKGYAVIKKTFDDHDREIEEAYLDRDRKQTAGPDGIAILRVKYDGDNVEQRFYDTAGQPVAHPCPVARATYEKRWAKPTMIACFDDKGSPALTAAGFAVKRIDFDDHGHETASQYFGVDGKPMLQPEGYATIRSKYDGGGHLIEQAYYDADGKLRPQAGGFAIERRMNDERGNIVETIYFGIDAQPVAGADGYHRQVSSYDEHGKQIEIAFFGIDGQPVMATDGYHRATGRYDSRGYITEMAFYGNDEKPMLRPAGYAIDRRVNDERGRTTQWAYFGRDAEPVVTTQGYHRLIVGYDDHGREVERAYFAPAGKPIETSRGFATEKTAYGVQGTQKITSGYDSHGREIERSTYGTDGKLADTLDGFALQKMTYDAQGNLAETSVYDSDRVVLARCKTTMAAARSEKGCAGPNGQAVHSRAVIVAISPGTQAERIGLKVGDIVEKYGDITLFSGQDLIEAVRRGGTPKLTVVIKRDGRTRAIDAASGRLGVEISTKFPADSPREQ